MKQRLILLGLLILFTFTSLPIYFSGNEMWLFGVATLLLSFVGATLFGYMIFDKKNSGFTKGILWVSFVSSWIVFFVSMSPVESFGRVWVLTRTGVLVCVATPVILALIGSYLKRLSS
jgi:hypothetical protein